MTYGVMLHGVMRQRASKATVEDDPWGEQSTSADDPWADMSGW